MIHLDMRELCIKKISVQEYFISLNVVMIYFVNRRPEDWTLSWGGSGSIFGWGHNHRGQLGGVEGAKVKLPTPCDTLTALRPVQLIGGEQTLFAVTADGKVFLKSTLFIPL